MKIACLSFTNKGELVGQQLESFKSNDYQIDHYANKKLDEGIKKVLPALWQEYDGLVFISATGIAVRMLAPFIEDKTLDPAVLVIDDLGRYVISLLSGHLGGANELAKDLSIVLGALPIITTASDSRGIESIDLFAQKNGYYIEDIKSVTGISSLMVNGEQVGLYTEDDQIIRYNHLSMIKDLRHINPQIKGLIMVSSREKFEDLQIPYTVLRPKNLNIGIGCKKGIAGHLIIKAINEELEGLNLSKDSIKNIGTVEIKKDEKGIIDAAQHFKCPLQIFTLKEIAEVDHQFEKSQFVKDTIGVYSVSGPVSFLLGGNVVSEKSRHKGITISIAKETNNG